MDPTDPGDWRYWLRLATDWVRIAVGLLGMLTARTRDRPTPARRRYRRKR